MKFWNSLVFLQKSLDSNNLWIMVMNLSNCSYTRRMSAVFSFLMYLGASDSLFVISEVLVLKLIKDFRYSTYYFEIS